MNNRLVKTFCVAIFITLFQPLKAQDERYVRKLLSGDLTRPAPLAGEAKYTYRARSAYFEIDLNGDHRSESFVLEKKDGEDWIHVFSYGRKKVYSYRFTPIGPNSRVYRITSKRLSKNTVAYILHYFEGTSGYLKFTAQARYYFLTIDNNDLKTLATYKGPAYWEEFKSFNFNHYHQRKYELTAVDFNSDGVKELSLRYNDANTVFFYRGKGAWTTF